jgi:abortive infection bacteriophage resistance protein
MKYDKEPLSLAAQADQLLARGLMADRNELITRLRAVNYYRLSGYALAICHFWLQRISSTSQWRIRLLRLFDEYPEVPLAKMGLPDDWREHPLFVGTNGRV